MTTGLMKAKRYRAVHGTISAARSVRPLGLLGKQKRAIPVLSEKTYQTFAVISDPANAGAFSFEAARKAFAHIKITG